MISVFEEYARYSVSHYRLMPVVLSRGEGIFLFDSNGKKYFDFNTNYSSSSYGHAHPRLIETLTSQAKRLSLVAPAFYHDKMTPALKKLCDLSRHECALLVNTGAEAVETAIKIARRYGYLNKQIEPNMAEIIVFSNNFHGRTLASISLSTNEAYRYGFGPFLPGIRIARFGDINDVVNQISNNTCAVLIEPIQGESGVHVSPSGFLKNLEQLCKDNDILLVLDEIQSGIGRAGAFMMAHLCDVQGDIAIFGKCLGGGLLPVSAVVGRRDVMKVMTPGSHGSTFGGNPLACAVTFEALSIYEEEKLWERSLSLGNTLKEALLKINSPLIEEIRGKGLFLGLDVDTDAIQAKDLSVRLIEKGLLVKETRRKVIRLMPPLIIKETELQDAIAILRECL